VADFDHFLLTRFSAVFVAGAPPASEDWLYYRLGFFVDAAHPSVVGQRHAEFTWLVVLDDRCPETFRDDVEDLASDGSFTPLWTHRPFGPGTFAPAVAARSDAPYLITTRMDSDDAIAVDFMAAVQGQFAEQDRLFVSFTRGVQLDRSGRVYRRDEISNPFLSFIERRIPGSLPATVHVAAAHTRARAHGPLREVKAPPMWAQVVHGTNLYNIVNGTRISPGVVNDRFALDLAYTRDVPFPRLLVEKAQHRARLMRLWMEHPSEPFKYAEARFWRLRGTHERPQNDGRTLMDRFKSGAARFGRRRA